jgi:sortase A
MAQEPPTRIVAPSIKLDAKIVTMGWEMVDNRGTMVPEWVVPKNAAGWHMNSALPGHEENIVISGHHNIDGKVFRYVIDLGMGDEIQVYADDIPYTYTVTEKYILKEAGMPLDVRKKNAQWIMPTGDERLTLVTCWPYEYPGNSHRVIVVARPEGYTDDSDPLLR